MRGKSLAAVLDGSSRSTYQDQEAIAGEMLNGKWLRQGTLKAVSVAPPYGNGQWKLFDLAEDPGETTDLSGDKPKLLKALQASWQQYAKDVGVVMTE
jgi:arylsulfatase